jgi:type I restriction enzyme S subunit
MSAVPFPEEWAQAKLSEAISNDGLISDGDWVESKDQDPDGSIRLIQLADVGDGDFRNKSQRFMTPESAERLNCTYLEKGDVLIARMPDPLGRACLFPGVGQKAVTVVDICLVRTTENSAFTNCFLKYWINTPEIRNLIESNASGTTRKRITRKKLEAFKYPVPPIAEQREIARRLDELSAQVDTLKTRLDAIPAILKRFRQSTLAAAVSGKLTEEWRGSSKFGKMIRIGDVALSIKYGTSKKCSPNIGETPVLRIPNIGNGKIDLSELKFADFDAKDRETLKLFKGDILLIRSNGSVELVGKAALIDETSEHCLYAGYLIRIRVDASQVFSKYLLLCIQSPQMRKVIELQSRSTSGVNNINSKELAALSFEAPSLEEQPEIVRRVEELFAFADQVEQRVKDAQARINNMTQSILAKAFRGELTADWRATNPDIITGENSAEALLARIKAEREELAIANKGKKTTVKKKIGSRMKSKQIIPIIAALEKAGKELSAQKLLEESGYPNDADTQTLEGFFLDIRKSLDTGLISKVRKGDEDFFTLKA